MSFIERGFSGITNFESEWEKSTKELVILDSEKLKKLLNKSAIAGHIGDFGKYAVLFGALVISEKTPPEIDCVLLPVSGGIAFIGLMAESHYGMQTRVIREVLIKRGDLKSSKVLLNELREEWKKLGKRK